MTDQEQKQADRMEWTRNGQEQGTIFCQDARSQADRDAMREDARYYIHSDCSTQNDRWYWRAFCKAMDQWSRAQKH